MSGLTASRAGLVPGLERLDERHVDAADEADLTALALEGGGRTGQEGALLRGEQQAGDVVTLAAAVEQLSEPSTWANVVSGNSAATSARTSS